MIGSKATMADAGIRPKIVVIIPAFREETQIGGVVAALRERGLTVVVIDDGSPDATAERAASHGATVLRHPLNRGQGAALQTGLVHALRAGADIIVTFDADGQHSPDDVDALVAPIAAGECDIVLGSRFLGTRNQIPTVRRWLLRAAVVFTRLTSGARVSDAHNGLRAFSRRAAGLIDLRLDRMAHASELIDQVVRARLPFREVPVHITYTEYSMTKGQTSGSAFRVAFDYVIARLLR
jgi:glycosyltransferase involved in cell wall biosynthesis